jgi:hypothetical protein
MEQFIIGCLTSLLAVAIINKRRQGIRLKRIGFRQSILHTIVKDMLPSNSQVNSKKDRQSKKHRTESVIRVIQTPDSKAYWVENNIFYCAEVVDGQFDPSSGQPVDTSSLTRKELDKLMFILDNLKTQNG